MGVDGEEMDSGRIDTSDDEVSSDVTLVAEEMLLEHSHAGNDSRLAAGAKCVKLEVGRHDCGGELSTVIRRWLARGRRMGE